MFENFKAVSSQCPCKQKIEVHDYEELSMIFSICMYSMGSTELCYKPGSQFLHGICSGGSIFKY